MSKKTEEPKIEIKNQEIKIKFKDYGIFISTKDNKIHLKFYPSKDKNISYYDDYSLEVLKNNNIFQKYKNIKEIYDLLKTINNSNSKILIEENENVFKLSIIIKTKEKKQEIITFVIRKEDDKPEKKDDSIFKNNLNNFENILNDIENDMCNLDPYVNNLEEENKKITEENINLKNQIKILLEENQKLKETPKNININNKNSEDNLTVSEKENKNKENLKQEKKIQVKKNENKKLNQENNNSNSNNQKIVSENNVTKNGNKNLNQGYNNSNPNNQKILSENKGTKNGNQKPKNLNKSNSIKNNITKNNILSKELENKIINYIRESESYKTKSISFKLLYKATIDNDSASSFHNKVDNKGSIIVIINTSDDRFIGGFSSKSWSSKDIYICDEEAFLFNEFIKFKIKVKDKACFHKKEDGPHFGQNALIIANNSLNQDNINNICGIDTYKFFPNKNVFGKLGKTNFIIKDYEVYHVYIK